MIESDRAFAPSTARHINRFHIIFELLALLTFLPEFHCLAPDDVCTPQTLLSRVVASLDSVIGPSYKEAARGRFLLGLTSLRLFGLIRHWKQMLINRTSDPTKREGIENWLIPQGKDMGDSVLSIRKTSSKKIEVRSIFRSVSYCAIERSNCNSRMKMKVLCTMVTRIRQN